MNNKAGCQPLIRSRFLHLYKTTTSDDIKVLHLSGPLPEIRAIV